jgi:hypothetical protein
MNDESPRDPFDRLVDAYERMLGHMQEGVEQFGREALPGLRERLAMAREKMVELGELSREEAERLSRYLERDMQDAARYLVETGEEFRNWLRTDISLIENRLLDSLAEVADQTSLQLKQWAEQARRTPYRTGEVTGPGVLICNACGEQVHFHKVGRIPPCPKCHATEYSRLATD